MANEVAKKRTRKDMSLESGNNKPGENRKLILQKLEIASWGDIQMSDPVAVKERCVKYLSFCAENDSKPSIAGLAFALGIDRNSLLRWCNGSIGKNEESRLTLKKTTSFINSLMEDYMQNGKINPVAGIFLMKNNMGYADKQEIEVAPKNPLGNAPDRKQLESEILESVYGEEAPVDD